MTTRTWLSAALVPMVMSMAWGCGDDDDDDTASDSDADSDADTGTGTDPGNDCTGEGVWYDGTSGLCWQDPPSDSVMNWYRASGTYEAQYNPDTVDHCGNLVHGGHSDWRLPDIDELITLLRGCQDGTATGDLSPSLCEMTPAECGNDCTGTSNCDYCSNLSGPGGDGHYWDPALAGGWTWYWSSSPYDSDHAWVVSFGIGYVYVSHIDCDYPVRCVR